MCVSCVVCVYVLQNYSTQHGAVVSLGHLVGSCLGQLGPGCHDVGSNGSMESMETSDTEMIVVIRKAIRRLSELCSVA